MHSTKLSTSFELHNIQFQLICDVMEVGENRRKTLLLGSRINTRISSNNSTCDRKFHSFEWREKLCTFFFNCRRYFVAEILFLNDIISEQTARQRELIRWQQSQSLQETFEQDDHVAGWCIHTWEAISMKHFHYIQDSRTAAKAAVQLLRNIISSRFHPCQMPKLWSGIVWYYYSTHNNMRVSYTHNNERRRNWKYFTYSFHFRPSSYDI